MPKSQSSSIADSEQATPVCKVILSYLRWIDF